MTGFVLALTISFSVLHLPTGSAVDSVTTETFQSPLKSIADCNRWAAIREASARRHLALIGVTEMQFSHTCLPAGEKES